MREQRKLTEKRCTLSKKYTLWDVPDQGLTYYDNYKITGYLEKDLTYGIVRQ